MPEPSRYEDRTTWEPLILFEFDDGGRYSLLLTDAHMVGDVADVFEQNGRESNGYAWSDVALQLMRQHAPAIESVVLLDPEAGMFSASGSDLPALQQLAGLLHQVLNDPAALGAAVAAAPWEND